DNDTAGTPGASPRSGSVANDANDTGGELERLDFAIGEKPDARAVRRPERIHSAVSAAEGTLVAGAQGTKVHFASRAVDDRTAIGGKSGLLAKVAFNFKG